MHEQIDRSTSDILSRIDRLERSNRRLRVAMVAILAAAGLGLAGFAANEPGQSVQREIQTQRLVVVGADQQPRVMLQGNTDGATVCLYGPDQAELTDPRPTGQEGGGASGGVTTGFSSLAPRMRLMVEGEECRVELIAPGGKTRAKLRYNAEGPALEMLDEEGNPIEG
jgi:hypothetical protein